MCEVEAGVLEQIDEAVKERVAAELPRALPRSQQNEVAFYRRQLQEVQRALHNSCVAGVVDVGVMLIVMDGSQGKPTSKLAAPDVEDEFDRRAAHHL